MICRMFITALLLGIFCLDDVRAQSCEIDFDIDCAELVGVGEFCHNKNCVPRDGQNWNDVTCSKIALRHTTLNTVKVLRFTEPDESGWTTWTSGDNVVCSVSSTCDCPNFDPIFAPNCDAMNELDDEIFADSVLPPPGPFQIPCQNVEEDP